MNIENHHIIVSGLTVEVVRKAIKNLHLGVYPPHGRVRVAAPLVVSDDAVKLAVISRLGWIKRQKAKFEAQPRQSRREMINSESHYFLGQRYRLEVIYKEAVPTVYLKGKSNIVLQVRPNSSAKKRRDVIIEWYRKELQPVTEILMTKWQRKLKVQVKAWKIQRMKTRWGTCNNKSARILLNLELAKKPPACIEYIIVHELLHLIEKKHNENFVNMLDKYIPKWRSIKEELNSSMLSHDEWNY